MHLAPSVINRLNCGCVAVTYVHRRLGPSGFCWGAGRRTARTARTVGPACCADSRHTRLRSRCRTPRTRPGQSGTTWSAGYTHTLRKKESET